MVCGGLVWWILRVGCGVEGVWRRMMKCRPSCLGGGGSGG